MAAALAAAERRRNSMSDQAAVLSTPTVRVTGKRSLPPKNVATPSTATTSASSAEKVTPDPKQIRVSTGSSSDVPLPSPRVLFEAAPDNVSEIAETKQAEVANNTSTEGFLV